MIGSIQRLSYKKSENFTLMSTILLSVHLREIRYLGYNEKDLLNEIHNNYYKLINIERSYLDNFAYILKYQH